VSKVKEEPFDFEAAIRAHHRAHLLRSFIALVFKLLALALLGWVLWSFNESIREQQGLVSNQCPPEACEPKDP
jgi:hypothetical protein